MVQRPKDIQDKYHNFIRPKAKFFYTSICAVIMAVATISAQAQTKDTSNQATPTTSSNSDKSLLQAIKARGYLICGVAGDRPGFSFPDSKGVMQGLDADTCRSVASAIFGSPDKVRFTPLTSLTRFPALQSGEVDMVARFTTWTLTREASLGLEAASVYMYDGEGFLVKKSSGVKSALELSGASICFQPGSTAEENVTDYFRAHKMQMKPVIIEKIEQLRDAFTTGRCDAYTNDSSQLGSFKLSLGAAGNDYIILPEIISKEPLSVFVRKGNPRFFDVVRWTHIAMLTAEEFGITQANIEKFRHNGNPAIQRLMGESGNLGAALKLDPQWAINVIKGVGNFSEMWDRDIAPLGIPRGLNRLVKDGGIQYAPPMR